MKKASDKILVKTLIEAYASQIIVAPIAMYYGFPQLQAMGMLGCVMFINGVIMSC